MIKWDVTVTTLIALAKANQSGTIAKFVLAWPMQQEKKN